MDLCELETSWSYIHSETLSQPGLNGALQLAACSCVCVCVPKNHFLCVQQTPRAK